MFYSSADEQNPKRGLRSPESVTRSLSSAEQLEKKGDKPLRELLQRVGGWPVVDGGQWNGENFDWVEQLIKFRKEGMTFDMIFDLSVSQGRNDLCSAESPRNVHHSANRLFSNGFRLQE